MDLIVRYRQALRQACSHLTLDERSSLESSLGHLFVNMPAATFSALVRTLLARDTAMAMVGIRCLNALALFRDLKVWYEMVEAIYTIDTDAVRYWIYYLCSNSYHCRTVGSFVLPKLVKLLNDESLVPLVHKTLEQLDCDALRILVKKIVMGRAVTKTRMSLIGSFS